MQFAQKNFYKKLLGRAGEKRACEFLKKKGFKILETNYKTFVGEIDIIALDKEVLVFIEVKTRTSDGDSAFGRPSDAVNAAKRKNVIRAAKEFLRLYCKDDGRAVRFDVIEVYVTSERKISNITHIKDAFSAY